MHAIYSIDSMTRARPKISIYIHLLAIRACNQSIELLTVTPHLHHSPCSHEAMAIRLSLFTA